MVKEHVSIVILVILVPSLGFCGRVYNIRFGTSFVELKIYQ